MVLDLCAELAHHVFDLVRELEGFVEGPLPDVAPEDQAGGASLHGDAGFLDDVALALHLAATEEDERLAGGFDDYAGGLLARGMHGVVGRGRSGVFLRVDLRDVDLDDVGADLVGNARGVIDSVEAVASALGVDGFTTRVGPDDDGHAIALGVLADHAELLE